MLVHHSGGEFAMHLGHGLLASTGPLPREGDLGDELAVLSNSRVSALYAGRAVESLQRAGFRVPRRGVAVFMVTAAPLPVRLGPGAHALGARVEAVLSRLGLPTRYRGETAVHVRQAMTSDWKRRGKDRRLLLLRAVGGAQVTNQVTEKDSHAVLETQC